VNHSARIAGPLIFIAADVKTIELWRCLYHKTCRVKLCRRAATIIARSFDTGGRPLRQYELCQQHADRSSNGNAAGAGKS
jgi:hypothetical protein